MSGRWIAAPVLALAAVLLGAAPAAATIAPTLHADAACETVTPHPGSSCCEKGRAGGKAY